MKKKYLDFSETCFVVLGVLFFSGSLGNLFREESPLHSLSIFVSLARWFIALGSVSLVAIRAKSLFRKSGRNVWLFAVIALGLISSVWSPSPDYSFARIRSEFFPMTAFGLYLGTSYGIKNQVRLLGYGLVLNMFLSYLLAFALPSIGRDFVLYDGAWVGVYGHKNTASAFMLLTALLVVLPSLYQSTARWFFVKKNLFLRILGAAALLFILMTRSGTGLVSVALLAFILFFYSRFKWRGKLTVLMLILTAFVVLPPAIYLLSNWHEIILGLGKDPTLTGRTLMWEVALRKIAENPIWGYGIGGFWAPGSSNQLEVARAVSLIGFNIDHLHNGYLDLVIDLGLIGGFFFLISLLITCFRALKQAYDFDEPEDLYPLGFLIFFILNNMTESYILYRSQLFWPLYVAIALNVGYSYLRRPSVARMRAEEPMSPASCKLGQVV